MKTPQTTINISSRYVDQLRKSSQAKRLGEKDDNPDCFLESFYLFLVVSSTVPNDKLAQDW